MTKPNQLDEDIEQLYEEWFYKFSVDEPDGTCTLVIHETHDGNAYTEFEKMVKSLIAKSQTEARIDEISNILNLFDVEFAYYGGGKPFSNATGTVSYASRIKKVVDRRLEELNKGVGGCKN